MKIQTIIACLGVILLLCMSLAVAEEQIPEIIYFDGAADGGGSASIHPSIYTGPVEFPHEDHFAGYTEGCGACHHDEEREPLEGYSADDSFSCADCHDEEGLIRGPIAENAASHDELIARRANVLHMLCIGCHKEQNAMDHVVRAPESCRICHAKRAQDWSLKKQ